MYMALFVNTFVKSYLNSTCKISHCWEEVWQTAGASPFTKSGVNISSVEQKINKIILFPPTDNAHCETLKHFAKPWYKNRNIANINFLSDAETSLSCFCLWDIFNHLLFVLLRVWAFLSCFDIGGISAINHHGIYKESRNSHKTRKCQPGCGDS